MMIKKKRSTGALLWPAIALVAGLVMATPAQQVPGWTLVWSDEFDGPDIDSSKWSHEVNAWGGGNNELQYYTARPENSFIEDGHLVIQALKETYTGPEGTRDYTSARLRTLNKGDWTYGRFEARMKLPYGQGLWPAFWMLPTDWVYGGWAASGEIDIMELVGHEPNVLHGTIHYHGEWPNNWSSSASWTLPSGDFSDDFHVFALEWEEGVIRWYVDDILYSTKTWWDTTSGAPFPAPFDERFHILLNVAVGGNWPGSPNATTVFPQRMTVDYVRVYSRDSTLPSGTNLLDNAGFESGSTAGWNLNLGGGAAAVETNYARSGTHALVIDSTGAGDWASPNVSQSFPAKEGDIFNIQGYMLNPAESPITGSSFGLFKIEFRNSSGTALEPASVNPGTSAAAPYYGAESRPFLTAASVTNAWMFSEAQAEAPAETAWVSFILLNVNQPGNLGPICFDDVQAVLVADPVIPFLLNSSIVGGDIEISFLAQDGISYQTLYKSCLTNADWIPIETIIGDGNTNTVSYAVSNPVSFYTVSAP